jgi:hypothetical protein
MYQERWVIFSRWVEKSPNFLQSTTNMVLLKKPSKSLNNMQKNQLIARTKKWMSSFLIFVIFAIQTIQIPLLVPKVSAAGSEVPNLVSILVAESTYSGEVASKIKRYAGDIQKALPNTRAVIVEVPDMIAPQTIAATNEKLYYEGDGNGIGRLVGTVLV